MLTQHKYFTLPRLCKCYTHTNTQNKPPSDPCIHSATFLAGTAGGNLPGLASSEGLEATERTEPAQGPGQQHHYEPKDK